MNIRKIFPFAISLLLVLSLFGCGADNGDLVVSPQNSGVVTDINTDVNTHDSLASEGSTTSTPSINSFSTEAEINILDVALGRFETLLSNVSDAINFYNTHDFSSIEEIKDYEAKWQTMSSEAQAIQLLFSVANPSKEYEKDWTGFANCMGELSEVLALGTNLNTNHDDKYTGEEVAALLREMGSEIVAISNEASAFAENILEIGNRTSNSNEKTCVSCGKSASDFFENPFSGTKEYYCTTHYQEMVRILSGMEEDVGESGLTPKCQQCSKAGTYEIIGLSGEMEYYCYSHYKEMADIIEYMLNG